jgi:uncharacterized damage-inducible protein DinB
VKDLAFAELIQYTTASTERWRAWFGAQPPEVWDIPVGSGRTATVRGLVHHIIVVEIRYVDRLRGDPVTEYESLAQEPATMFSAFADGRRRLNDWLARASDDELRQPIEFQTISAGMLRASKRKIVAHLLIHGIRHWAQLATVLRQQGHATDWMHDILMSDALA